MNYQLQNKQGEIRKYTFLTKTSQTALPGQCISHCENNASSITEHLQIHPKNLTFLPLGNVVNIFLFIH